jgi:ADP-ribosylglycohydrolase
MIGSLLGDIIGSRFEFMSTQEKNVNLFHRDCSWTDDSVLTHAVSKVCSFTKENNINDEFEIEKLFVAGFKKAIDDFPMAGWGKSFHSWSRKKNYEPNDSAGNGCLMRISPVVLHFKDLETIQKIGRICTKVSHNNLDSYKSVEVFLDVLHYLVQNISNKDIETKKEKVKEIANKHEIVIESVEHYHKIAGYWGLAKDTLPRSLAAYLEGNSFDSIMKNVLYVGSDTDTTATIAGSLTELTYSLSAEDLHQVYRYYDHKSFYMIKHICSVYLQEENKELLNNLFSNDGQEKIKELFSHKPVDQTAQWDPLELPSDEEYYKLDQGFSLKKLLVKLFWSR